jgi:hypothetical protein
MVMDFEVSAVVSSPPLPTGVSHVSLAALE